MLLLKNGTERKGVEKKKERKKKGEVIEKPLVCRLHFMTFHAIYTSLENTCMYYYKHINNYIASILDYCVPRFDFNIRIFRNNKERKGKKNKKTNRIM